MPKPIKPVGTNPLEASTWKSVQEWKRSDIHPYPGVYEICYAPNGVRAALTLGNTHTVQQLGQMRAEEHVKQMDLTGVIYIGKAVCFKDRFWHLIKTWTKQDPTGKNHGSYMTWLAKNLQSTYQVSDLLFRYLPVSQEIWHPKIVDYVGELQAMFVNQDGHDPDCPAGQAAFALENKLLRDYIRYFGDVPPLNMLGAQQKMMTEDEMDAHLANLLAHPSLADLEDLGKPLSALNENDTD